MTIDISGCNRKLAAASILVSVEEIHPLVILGNSLPWPTLADIVLPDLKRTTAKGCWFMGRKLLVRVHLAAYTLQKIYDLTDRQARTGTK